MWFKKKKNKPSFDKENMPKHIAFICYGNRREEAFAAFSPSPVSDGGGFEALIGGVLL